MTLKPFDLESALRGDRVVTRGEMEVLEVIAFKNDISMPVFSLQKDKDGSIEYFFHFKDGSTLTLGGSGDNDLFMAPKTKKLYIGIYKQANDDCVHEVTKAYPSEDEAINATSPKRMFTIKEIEIEV